MNQFRASKLFLRLSLAIILMAISIISINAQELSGSKQTLSKSSSSTYYKPGNCWTLTYPLGFNIPTEMDTLTHNYQRLNIPSMVSDAFASEGNLGSPGIDMLFFQRPERSQFIFNDAIKAWIPTEYKQKFYNVYIPMTLLSYNFGGGRDTKNDRLQATFAGNVNRRIGIGASLDYIYAKGSYAYQAAKEFNFGFEGYYKGDRYEMQAFYNHFGHRNMENGGITDDLYILDPAVLQGGVSSINSTSIPTNLTGAQNSVNGTQFWMNHTYKVGFWRDQQVNDTLTRQIYIPVTKFIYSLNYQDGTHVFKNNNPAEAEKFWLNRYMNDNGSYDRTHYWELSNTLGVEMIEGFNKWVPFGLAAYATFETRRFRLPSDYSIGWSEESDSPASDQQSLTPWPQDIPLLKKGSQNLLWIGANLISTQHKIFHYSADARFGLSGDAVGDIHINAELGSQFKLLGDTVEIKAKGFFKNAAQPWLLQHYISNHFIWNNDFGKTRDFRINGELTIPWTKTKISAGLENLQNYVFFNANGLPTQNGGNIQIFSATLDQKLSAGIWNWDNQLTYQATSDNAAIPLPALTVYSNMYLKFTAFNVLHTQIGIDCDYYTRYRGMNYQPALMAFTTNDDSNVGNFFFCNIYATMKLYKVRFYVLYSHANHGLFSKNAFAMPHYPVAPARLQLGLSIDFAN
ncbi:MAG: putative porin [Prevotella sp.]|nr:putative porin [Bacteroides sp.]MCM1366792.1 putative porin [Prevotella sp.]MCM1436459.1 putative porin [Prevotella sp.]